ncbi:STAS domain-containing protein [Streptomyces sp. NBC_00019]|uniref:STAS domain-containing protein n=1 Tax=Streptomyces sp. NBC_00019 TaxID=2975623 RepID=UPI00324D65AC
MRSAQLNVYRHDRDTRALITLAGEIDLATAPLLRSALTACVHDGIRTVDVDLTAVTFCDVSHARHGVRQECEVAGLCGRPRKTLGRETPAERLCELFAV